MGWHGSIRPKRQRPRPFVVFCLQNLQEHYTYHREQDSAAAYERGSKELGLKSLITDKRDHIYANQHINVYGFRVSQYALSVLYYPDRVWEYATSFLSRCLITQSQR